MAVSVFFSVLLAKMGYMTAAAVASVFPGIFLTTMVLLLLLLLLLSTPPLTSRVAPLDQHVGRPGRRRAYGRSRPHVLRFTRNFFIRG